MWGDNDNVKTLQYTPEDQAADAARRKSAGDPNWFEQGLTGAMNLWPGVSEGNLTLAGLPAAMTTAYKQWKDADKYREVSERGAQLASPFADQREFYEKRLRDLYEDPTQIENTPGYKFSMQQGQGALAAANASKGYLGSGKMNVDLLEHSQGLAAQTFDAERKALMQMSGSWMNDGEAANVLMKGNDQAINSQNAALAAMFTPFGQQAQQNQRKANGDGKGGSLPGLARNRDESASDYIQRAVQSGIKIDPNNSVVNEAINEMTGGQTPWNAGGYTQGYDVNQDGQVSYDEWAEGNNQGVMDGLGGYNDDYDMGPPQYSSADDFSLDDYGGGPSVPDDWAYWGFD